MAYKLPQEAPDTIVFRVPLVDPATGETSAPAVTARHLKAHQYDALDDYLVGIPKGEADGTGEREITCRRAKLVRVIKRIEDVDPEVEATIGTLDNEKSIGRLLEADPEFAWYCWEVYVRANFSAHLFRSLPSGGAGDGGDDTGDDTGGSAEGARVSDLPGESAAASGPG